MAGPGAGAAGTSGTPLPRKLGLKPGMRALLVGAPQGYREALDAPEGVRWLSRPAAGLDFVQLFTTSREDLEARFPGLRDRLAPAGMLWVSWPKKASGVATDLTGDVVREAGLAAGLVDVKVCAVDAVWSGLRFVRRVADRGEARGR